MLSSEISDLENFIDSYVAPSAKSSNSPAAWSRTHSYEEGYARPIATNQFNNFQDPRNTGTEVWGQKPGGSDWHVSEQTRQMHDWNEYRPRVQERQPHWQQQLFHEQQQQQRFAMPPNAVSSYQPPGPQDPAHIQAIVSDLIRQNNMNKVKHLPSWVDISKPPPPLPGAMSAPTMAYMAPDGNFYVDPREERVFVSEDSSHITHEPILHSMTFQRSNIEPSAEIQVPRSVQYTTMPNTVASESWGENLPYNTQMQYSSPQMMNVQPQYYNPSGLVAPPSVNNNQEPEVPDFQMQIMQGGMYERPDMPKLEKPDQIQTAAASYHQPMLKTEEEDQEPPPLLEKGTVLNATSESTAQQRETFNRSSSTSAQEKYPNSRFRNSHGSLEDDDTLSKRRSSNHKAPQRQGSEEVFENDNDERWKIDSRNIQVQINNKKQQNGNNRRKSTADEDPNWRRRESNEDAAVKTPGQYNRHSSTENDQTLKKHQKESRDRREQTSTAEWREQRKPVPRKHANSSATKKEGAENSDFSSPRQVTQRSKVAVQSWLQNEEAPSGDSVGKEIRRLQVSDSEADLSKFIETTQSFATTEAKMREVAEILCNKALKDTKFGRNAAILCDRMSFMMVHGTKFRTVVLNVMQGHYKNRDRIYSASFNKDKRWFGFVTFLVEIFLNVRTSTRERLLVLINPVFNSLFQVLTGEKIDQEHIERFGNLFARVGPALEAENQAKLNELISEIRDRCVISKTPFVKRVLLHCVELYASKWKEFPS